MYEIRPESLKNFIEDSNIKLPRFQRKQTWDDKKNFELVVSIFKEYPMGVSILNVEDNEGIKTRWLLDGRQRRNALLKFYEDPENIYLWARKYLKLKNNDQPQDVEDKFWEAINEYLEDDEIDEEQKDEKDEKDSELGPTVNEVDQMYLIDDNGNTPVYDSANKGLDLLLHIIKMSHNKTTKHSGFTRPFDFSKEIGRLPYMTVEAGKEQLSSKRLKSFLNEYQRFCSDEDINHNESDSFKKFLEQRFGYDEKVKKQVETKIDRNWDKIIERIDILNKITNIYLNSKIGLIEVKNLSSVDSQKIFNIINSKGTTLSAVEILSAKPSWNVVIDNLASVQIKAVKDLYDKIKVPNTDIVKWDLPATLLSRLDYSQFFFKTFSDSHTDLSKAITLGFKLLSGILEGGVKKEDIDSLGKDKNINWDVEFEKIISELNQLHKIILSYDYFKFLESWRFEISSQLSDAIALNFTILVYKDWVRKGKPIGNDTKMRQFQKNSFILIDTLFYEYVNQVWRGSSDSKIANNISGFSAQDHAFKPISEDKWKELLNEIFGSQTIDGNKITRSLMEPLLYHFYALDNISGPDARAKIEVDHILPQELFKNSAGIENKDVLMHSLFNLALLPKNENSSKSNKRLVQITDPWLKDQIKKYAFISEEDYQKYSDISNYKELKQFREARFLEAFTTKRMSILNN
ncbi:DUF262 domain-containing protein [Psychrobacter sanguinis]|uniref:DUF262 domain-containing protein n=1 Tax=Psychrobacter sanguinis TaxID=861445 RepID=UPI001917CC17|nr:DUF262 domain-containing protein [Psychrobacter sanguinis]MCC3345489.1 DUF262 domain-containing HNH endonuclease family protein [Psychrobacter sanguinis]